MVDDKQGKASGEQAKLPDYVQFEQKSAGDCKNVDSALAAHLVWVLANADRWYLNGKVSPGMISDAILKNVDQRLDLEKLSKTGGLIEPEKLLRILAGKPLEMEQGESS